jgi:Fe-S cluster assembly ATP-binding protein
MGPNGSGKSTLANTLLASPEYQVVSCRTFYKGDDISQWPTDARAKAGIFLGFQYPQEIAGVSVIQFLRQALSARKGIDLSVLELRLSAMSWMKRLGMDSTFVDRYLNEGFSGGEKKRNEIMQMLLLRPRFSVLDETDSGLDIDSLKTVAQGVNSMRGPDASFLLITHYQRLLNYIEPDFVHVFHAGRIAVSGGRDLALKLEAEGYDWVREASAKG